MRISPIATFKINNFRGIEEAKQYRESSNQVLKDIAKMDIFSKNDYVCSKNKKPSIQKQLRQILFNLVPTVGKENVNEDDIASLQKIKALYAALEEQHSARCLLYKEIYSELEKIHF